MEPSSFTTVSCLPGRRVTVGLLDDQHRISGTEAYWRRPEAYLDERVRRAVSVGNRVGPEAEKRAANRLRDDLSSGRWAERDRDLVALDAAELGLRLLVA